MAAMSASAFAQSSVTMYGVIDLATVYRTHVDASGNHAFSLGDTAGSLGDGGEGAFSGSRLGFKGTEDLGGGLKALFQLEAGLTANNGQSDQQGQLFGRQSYVGLSDKDLGTLTAGRQYGVATQFTFDFDPLGLGNFVGNEWEAFLSGIRFDNSLEYSNSVGPVGVVLQYSVGGQAGSIREGSTLGVNLKYVDGPIAVGGMYQQSYDVNLNTLKSTALGGTYDLGVGKVFANYYYVQRDAGFHKASALSGGPLANTSSIAGNATTTRKDNVLVLGANYKLTSSDLATVGGMYDDITNATDLGNGKLGTVYATVEHSLSKRTEVYAYVDYQRASGQAIGNGGNSLNGIGSGYNSAYGLAVGVKHAF